jgi:hypothetical protein
MVRIRNSQGYLELDESKLVAVLAAARWAVSSRPSQQKRDDKHTAHGGNETESFRLGKRLRRKVNAAETNEDLQDFMRRTFRNGDVGGNA